MSNAPAPLPSSRQFPLKEQNPQQATFIHRPLSTFIGREAVVGQVRERLTTDTIQLVTIIGTGGVGKTRLAIEATRDIDGTFPGGVTRISLASVREPSHVALVVARAFGIPALSAGEALEVLNSQLQDSRVLLVLDNLEHLLDARVFLARLLGSCTGLTALVTSRVRLNIAGEHLVSLSPMALPTDGNDDVELIGRYESVRLFVDRAAARGIGFSLTQDNAATVAEICRQLDGLPLAIELATARLNVLSLDGLRDRLDRRLPLLTDGLADAYDRHHTMQRAIAWSYDLLDAPLQSAFRRLAMCVGGFTLETVSAMIENDEADVLPVIGKLVDSSLLIMNDMDSGEARYTMLETIREFGLDRLAASGDEPATRDRHADHFQAIAEWSDWAWAMIPAEGEDRLARLQMETENIRVALDWLQHRERHGEALHMAACLGSLWVVLGHPLEGAHVIERSLRAGTDLAPAVRARALSTMSWAINSAGDPAGALALARESLAIWRTLDDPVHSALALVLCAVPAYRTGDATRRHVAAWLEEARAKLAPLDAPGWVANMRSMITIQAAQNALLRGDIEYAESLYRAAAEEEASRGFDLGESFVYGSGLPLGMADMARLRARPGDALPLYQRGLSLAWPQRNIRGVAQAIGGIAGALAALGDHVPAARLFGVCEAMYEAAGFDFDGEYFDRQRAFGLPEPWLHAKVGFGDLQHLHAAMSEHPAMPPITDTVAVAEAWAVGRRLPLDVAVNQALKASAAKRTADADVRFGLSARELEVLRLLVAGHTDAQIAKTLFISRRTASAHVQHIYVKLDVSNRAEAAAWAVRNGIA